MRTGRQLSCTKMHAANRGVRAQTASLRHELGTQFGAIDRDAGRSQLRIPALVNLHLRDVQASGAEVEADLLANGAQDITRADDSQP